jgi:signal transduction histidine kinase
MKAHGGTVSVASEPGNGATFTLHFGLQIGQGF